MTAVSAIVLGDLDGDGDLDVVVDGATPVFTTNGAYDFNAVPEPSGGLLVAMGMIGVAAHRRRLATRADWNVSYKRLTSKIAAPWIVGSGFSIRQTGSTSLSC